MTKGEFEAMTKDELVEYADDRDIEVHHHWTKDEIIKEIMKAEKKAAKSEAEPEAEAEEHTASKPEVRTDETQPADQPAVDPKLAALQEQAQRLPDENVRFSADPPKEK